MKKWEYRIVTEDREYIGVDVMNSFGSDGWELVSVIPVKAMSVSRSTDVRMYFKRFKEN